MSDSSSVLEVVGKLSLALSLVAFNGFFVAAEFALVKVRDTQLEGYVQRRHRRAGMVRHILGHLDGYLSACQLGITLASLALGWVAEPVFAALLEPVFGWFQIESAQLRHLLSASVGIMAVTFFHVVVGEQAPKFIAIKRPLPASLWVAYPLHWFYVVTYPLIWVLNWTSLWVLQRLGIETSGHGEVHSEDELRLMLGSTLAAGGSSVLAREIVQNSLDLGRRRVREVMRPRREIVALDIRRPIAPLGRRDSVFSFSIKRWRRSRPVDGRGARQGHLLAAGCGRVGFRSASQFQAGHLCPGDRSLGPVAATLSRPSPSSGGGGG